MVVLETLAFASRGWGGVVTGNLVLSTELKM